MAKARADFDATFKQLRKVLDPAAGKLVVVHDSDENFCLDAPRVMENGKRMFFGSVRKSKTYVSFHLMPVYVHPEMLATISPELRKRMQGKSCFNFKTIDDSAVKELSGLVKAGLAAFKKDGYL